MNKTNRLAGKFGIVLCGMLLGYTACGQPSVAVGLPSVTIRTESDFYEPLAPQGEWVVIGSYGRCWRPTRVEADWRPYSEGYWQLTDAGWYWVSDEPWAWATYHYGRWDFTEQNGWYWVPQTQWAPAWVSWHSGGGYIGWSPLNTPDVRVISPRAFVFVEERHFMDPVHRSTVVANNTAIINKTVINKAPTTAVIEKASGRKIAAVPVQQLRHKEEVAVVSRQRAPASTSERKVQTPGRVESEPRVKETIAAPGQSQVERPAAVIHEPVAPAPKNREVQGEKQMPAPVVPKLKPEARPSDRQAQPPAPEKPGVSERDGSNPADKDHEKKDKE